MPTKEEKAVTEEFFEPTADERGRLRLDRRLTPEEAAAQDAEHRALYEENRAARFGTPEAPHKSTA
jgi:hypothetical protein